MAEDFQWGGPRCEIRVLVGNRQCASHGFAWLAGWKFAGPASCRTLCGPESPERSTAFRETNPALGRRAPQANRIMAEGPLGADSWFRKKEMELHRQRPESREPWFAGPVVFGQVARCASRRAQSQAATTVDRSTDFSLGR